MTSSRMLRWAGLAAVALLGCANRGMQGPGDEPDSGLGTGGIQASGGRGGSATGGTVGSGGAGMGGAAGSLASTGGRGGTGGTSGIGGTPGAGGTSPGTGGTKATGGAPGTGGVAATGGTTGTGGVAGAGGKAGAGGNTSGAGGIPATGGTTGTGGITATGGTGGAAGAPATGGTTGTGGAGGKGGAGGSAGGGGAAGSSGVYVCSGGGTLDCSSAGALKVPGGLVTDFSTAQWNATTNQFCDADGLRGRLFSYTGTATNDAVAVSVDTTAQNLKIAVTSKDYAGGGLIFESCTNVSAYTSVQFTATLASGSLSGCTWQVQLQTQEQRRTTDTDPTGGTCSATTCYSYPAVGGLAAPAATGTTYTELFTAFTPASTVAATPTQVVGVQWQITSSSGNGCTAELRIDNIKFQ